MSYLQLHLHQCRVFVAIFLAACVLSLSSTASAQMNIEITGVGQALYPIAVMRFQNEAKLPTSVTDIIRQDLARSGYFKNTENGNATESDEGTPNYKTWAARGADALVGSSWNPASPGALPVPNHFALNTYSPVDISRQMLAAGAQPPFSVGGRGRRRRRRSQKGGGLIDYPAYYGGVMKSAFAGTPMPVSPAPTEGQFARMHSRM